MKDLNNKLVKTILSFCLLAVLLTACTENQKATNEDEQNTTIATPKIDIHAAVLYGNIEAVKQHIAAGSDLNKKEPLSGSTPLISAITFDQREIAQLLIEEGTDLEIQNNDGSTALHVAAFFCRKEMVQMLLDSNVDQSKKNNFGATALESISGPFAEIKPAYEMVQAQLGPLGLKLDLAELEKNRPIVADLLK